jgi:hypothetical protein
MLPVTGAFTNSALCCAAQKMTVDAICLGLENVLPSVAAAPAAAERVVELYTLLQTADVLPFDAVSPPLRDFLVSNGFGDSGDGDGGRPSVDDAVKALLATGAQGEELLAASKTALDGYDNVERGVALVRLVLEVRRALLCCAGDVVVPAGVVMMTHLPDS